MMKFDSDPNFLTRRGQCRAREETGKSGPREGGGADPRTGDGNLRGERSVRFEQGNVGGEGSSFGRPLHRGEEIWRYRPAPHAVAFRIVERGVERPFDRCFSNGMLGR